jgi:nitrate reductase NapE component
MRERLAARTAFAIGMIALGIVGFIYGDFAQIWHFAPAVLRRSELLPYASAALMLVCGVGLLWTRTEALAARVLLPYWALVVLVLKIHLVVESPLVEMTWLTAGLVVIVLTGAWILAVSDARSVRVAQLLFGASLIPLGLSHFFYMNLTAPLVPAWLPFHTGWGYFTGTAHIAAGLGVLLGIYPRLAATLEAAMLGAFTFLVWIPLIVAKPTTQFLWSEITMSWAVSAAAWVVAASIPKKIPATAARPDAIPA